MRSAFAARSYILAATPVLEVGQPAIRPRTPMTTIAETFDLEACTHGVQALLDRGSVHDRHDVGLASFWLPEGAPAAAMKTALDAAGQKTGVNLYVAEYFPNDGIKSPMHARDPLEAVKTHAVLKSKR